MEAHDLAVRVRGRKTRLQPSLGVDQLDRTDDLVVVVAHRHREHRLRSIPELGIEALATNRLSGRRVVRIVVDLALTDGNPIPADGLLFPPPLKPAAAVLPDRLFPSPTLTP